MDNYDFLFDFVSNNGKRRRNTVPNFGTCYQEDTFSCRWKTIHRMFVPISEDEASILEKDMHMSLPNDYRWFLLNVSNGLDLYNTTLCFYGKRTHYNRKETDPQPFTIITPNTYERPQNATDNMVFIGSYYWDGSRLYIDKTDNSVHFCSSNDATSKKKWNSFYSMLSEEITRLECLYGRNGERYDVDICSLPRAITGTVL